MNEFYVARQSRPQSSPLEEIYSQAEGPPNGGLTYCTSDLLDLCQYVSFYPRHSI